ncbi:DUF1616 domain-containing protein [Natronoarchaeum rubrum]|uniref:DUF1616 domain-containing protein n=1 Tax=Natronoarchaeum rubrum TaxID=755311 RepID=UPI00211327B3|nr:DUF1616 domain-containing protein [Natronoarchaeum rubrum]
MTNPDVSTSTPGLASRLATRIPSDVYATLAFLVLVNLAVVVVGVESPPLRVALSAPLLLFLPGYVLVASLFPRASLPEDHHQSSGWNVVPAQHTELDGPERAALSFGLSLAVLPLFGIAIAFSPWPFADDVVVPGLSLLVLLGAATSAARRGAVAPESRFDVPFRAWAGRLWNFISGDGAANTVVNVALVLSVVLSVAVVGYAFAAPQDGERYSGLSLVTENESGEYVAGGYPENFTAGEERDLTVAVENSEQVETEYTVVTRVERVDTNASGGPVTVLEATELRRATMTLDPGQRRYDEHAVAPETTGENLLLSYYLYRGDAPETVGPDTAYRHVYIWIDVSDDSAAAP